MNEVICHIGSYDVWEAFKLSWALLVLNGLSLGAIYGVIALFLMRRK